MCVSDPVFVRLIEGRNSDCLRHNLSARIVCMHLYVRVRLYYSGGALNACTEMYKPKGHKHKQQKKEEYILKLLSTPFRCMCARASVPVIFGSTIIDFKKRKSDVINHTCCHGEFPSSLTWLEHTYFQARCSGGQRGEGSTLGSFSLPGTRQLPAVCSLTYHIDQTSFFFSK